MRKLIVDIVYPVGSIYITTDKYLSTKAAVEEAFGGSWKKLNPGYYLKSVEKWAGEYKDQTLPNIRGTFSDFEVHESQDHPSIFSTALSGSFSLQSRNTHVNYYANGTGASSYSQTTQNQINQLCSNIASAFEAIVPVFGAQIKGLSDLITGSGGHGGSTTAVIRKDTGATRVMDFNANKYEPIYSDGADVNPYAYTVYMYERIA